MVKWEYKVEKIAFDSHNVEDILNKYGEEGWELVFMVDRLNGYKLFIFKRLKEYIDIVDERIEKLNAKVLELYGIGCLSDNNLYCDACPLLSLGTCNKPKHMY